MMTISNEDILKYFMTDEYPHDAGTLAAKEKIEQLQTALAESEARVERLTFALCYMINNSTIQVNHPHEVEIAEGILNETKSQSLQHIRAEAVNICTNDLISETEVINESPQHIGAAAVEKYRNELKQQARTVRNFSNPKEIFVAIPVSALDVELRQQQTNGSDGDE